MRIGITERGDAGIDLTWIYQMNNVDAAVLITKKVTGDFRREALRFKDKLIVHATCTGYGSTRIEPNVYPYFMQLNNTKLLVLDGFPINQVYIRVDPIIPTDEGIAVANNVITMAENLGFYKFRVSVIDMYKHVVNRFNRAGIEMPFSGFQATNEQFDNVSKCFSDIISQALKHVQRLSLEGYRM